MTTEQERIFNEIYKAHFDNIKNFCGGQLDNDVSAAENVAQMAFLILYVKWDTLPSHTEIAVLAWLRKTLKSIMKNLPEIQSGNTPILDEYTEKAYETICKKAIEQELSADEIQLFNYVVNKNLSLFEISVVLGQNVNTVKSRWLRLRKKIQKIIKNQKTL